MQITPVVGPRDDPEEPFCVLVCCWPFVVAAVAAVAAFVAPPLVDAFCAWALGNAKFIATTASPAINLKVFTGVYFASSSLFKIGPIASTHALVESSSEHLMKMRRFPSLSRITVPLDG